MNETSEDLSTMMQRQRVLTPLVEKMDKSRSEIVSSTEDPEVYEALSHATSHKFFNSIFTNDFISFHPKKTPDCTTIKVTRTTVPTVVLTSSLGKMSKNMRWVRKLRLRIEMAILDDKDFLVVYSTDDLELYRAIDSEIVQRVLIRWDKRLKFSKIYARKHVGIAYIEWQ